MILGANRSSIYCDGDGTSLLCPPIKFPQLGGLSRLPWTPEASNELLPPVAKQISYNYTYHGKNYMDEYHWLRDDKRESKEVLDHLEAENAYFKDLLSPLKSLEYDIFNEINSQRPVGTRRSFELKGGYKYYSRLEKGLQYPIYSRVRIAEGSSATEEVLLDLNKINEAYLELGAMEVSPEHKFLAYTLDTTGDEKYSLIVQDLEKGATSVEARLISAGIFWSNDARHLYYITQDDVNRPYRLFRHEFGNQQSSDILLYEEKDQYFSVGIKRSLSEKYLFVTTKRSTASELHYLDLDNPTSPLKLFSAREENRIYRLEHQGNSFIVLTNRYMGEKYINNILLRSPISQESFEKDWSEVVPYDINHYITHFYPLEKYLVLEERVGGYTQLRVIDTSSTKDTGYLIEFPETIFTVYALPTLMKYNSTELFYKYSSFVTPKSYFSYNLTTRNIVLIQTQGMPMGFKSRKYASERVIAPNNVPISLVYRKDLFLRDGSNPLHLIGYGSYGGSFDPEFSASIISLIDRGFVYAIAHVRGGSEMGRQWYEIEGKLLQKKNTFRDFSNAARHLVAKNYTSPGKLSIEGESAGGLLVGAVVNLNPGLFNAVIMEVPFVDVINTMMDPTLPLTLDEYDEWGDPNNKTFFQYMMSYSPYDNLPQTGVGLPHFMVRSGFKDTHVGYWEAAKYVARLRAILSKSPKANTKRIVHLTNLETGHTGSSGRYNRLKEEAEKCAFVVATAKRYAPFL